MSRMAWAGKSDIGLKRRNNEDTFLISTELGFCLVADGIGGAAAGEVASRTFAETAGEIFQSAQPLSEKDVIQTVRETFKAANERVREHIRWNPAHLGMGCTAELLAFHPDGFVLGHLGDSRTYRLRDAQFTRLTSDHTLVQAQLEQGLITPEAARTHPMRHVILRAVSGEEAVELDLIRGKILPGDGFLLCSDGLTDMVDDARIHEILAAGGSVQARVDRLVEEALAAGGRDNVTVVFCEVVG
ncbi:Protein serine/threonine phosphatase PrpC,regulation of stationary phase [uncultured Desulfatiglans sp.]|nr:Protein serine/threonine phosphatase PrpC,regulation of stationary phase [uncultured Desulfatiglans sp.]